MLKLVFGNDKEKVAEEVKDILDNIEGEKIFFDSDTYKDDKLKELSIAKSLFGGNKKIILFNIFTDKKQENINEILEDMRDSDSLFIFSEEKMLKRPLSYFEDLNIEIREFKKIENKKRKAYEDEPFNIFLLTDALGEKNKKKIWVLFREAVENNSPIDEIHGLLNWQVKNMIIVKTMEENTGLHPFVYQKTQKFTANYSLEELKEMSSKLVSIFHEGNRDIEFALEKFILSI